jgi:hypothetical protein
MVAVREMNCGDEGRCVVASYKASGRQSDRRSVVLHDYLEQHEQQSLQLMRTYAITIGTPRRVETVKNCIEETWMRRRRKRQEHAEKRRRAWLVVVKGREMGCTGVCDGGRNGGRMADEQVVAVNTIDSWGDSAIGPVLKRLRGDRLILRRALALNADHETSCSLSAREREWSSVGAESGSTDE